MACPALSSTRTGRRGGRDAYRARAFVRTGNPPTVSRGRKCPLSTSRSCSVRKAGPISHRLRRPVWTISDTLARPVARPARDSPESSAATACWGLSETAACHSAGALRGRGRAGRGAIGDPLPRLWSACSGVALDDEFDVLALPSGSSRRAW